MNWKVFIPQDIKNIYCYCRIKQKFPHLMIDEKTRLDLSQLDTYEFGKGVSVLSSVLGAGCKIGSYSFIGDGSTVFCTKEFPVTIGKYCSVGPNVSFYSLNHTMDIPSTSSFPFTFAKKREMYENFASVAPITLGNDIWIGRGAVITSGVNIGHGAVIGANAVVTKDVEPYSVVGGVPARLIRKRFSDGKIAELLEMKWWDWPEEKIADSIKFFSTICKD